MLEKPTGAIILMVSLFSILIVGAWTTGVSKELVIALAAVAVSVTGWTYASSTASNNEAVARASSEKAAVYKKIFVLFPELIKIAKGIAPSSASNSKKSDIAAQMLDIKSELLIWASDDTIKAWLDMEQCGVDNPENMTEILASWEDLFDYMRNDLGYIDVEFDANDIAKFLLDAKDRALLSEPAA